MAHDMYKLQGEVPEMIMMGQTADISFICEFEWYSWVYYNESITQFPEVKVVIGRYLGPTEPEVGSVMTAKILKYNGEVLRRNTFRHLKREEFDTEECIKVHSEFNVMVDQRLGDPVNEAELKSEAVVASVTPEFEVYDDNEQGRAMPPIDPIDLKGIDRYDPDSYDGYITAQVLLPRGDD